ncbi:unnamed protein product [Lactuca virosa]|uniref:Uncharacterized protein n=1 Tax=Lactuca virosa TaxID=75947 RepID=A0AAU9LLF7_9ASTR|nr:unnamed protein product [Lactuca virosa]
MAGAVVDGSIGVWLLLIVRKNEGGRSCSHRRGCNSRRWLTGIDVGKNVWVWLLTEIVRLFGLGDSKKLKKGETIVLLFHLTEKEEYNRDCEIDRKEEKKQRALLPLMIQKDRSIFLCERKTWDGMGER